MSRGNLFSRYPQGALKDLPENPTSRRHSLTYLGCRIKNLPVASQLMMCFINREAPQRHKTKASIAPLMLAAFLGLSGGVIHAQEIREESPLPPAPKKSLVVITEDKASVNNFKIVPERVTRNFNEAFQTFASTETLKEGWASMINPEDIVAIKINTIGGPSLATKRPIIQAIVDGLKSVGLQDEQIIVWDKFEDHIMKAGYAPMPNSTSWSAVPVIPKTGFDGKKFLFDGIAGQLIWGDHDFKGTVDLPTAPPDNNDFAPRVPVTIPGGPPKKKDSIISNRSYFANIITKRCTKIINVAVMSDHQEIGIHGALSSLALGSVDNNRRFLNSSRMAAEAMAKIIDHPLIREKVVFHVMDGIIAQFAGGPTFDPHYATQPGKIMISKDPVALDTLIRLEIEAERKEKQVPSMGFQAIHIEQAEAYELGTAQIDNIRILHKKIRE